MYLVALPYPALQKINVGIINWKRLIVFNCNCNYFETLVPHYTTVQVHTHEQEHDTRVCVQMDANVNLNFLTTNKSSKKSEEDAGALIERMCWVRYELAGLEPNHFFTKNRTKSLISFSSFCLLYINALHTKVHSIDMEIKRQKINGRKE